MPFSDQNLSRILKTNQKACTSPLTGPRLGAKSDAHFKSPPTLIRAYPYKSIHQLPHTREQYPTHSHQHHMVVQIPHIHPHLHAINFQSHHLPGPDHLRSTRYATAHQQRSTPHQAHLFLPIRINQSAMRHYGLVQVRANIHLGRLARLHTIRPDYRQTVGPHPHSAPLTDTPFVAKSRSTTGRAEDRYPEIIDCLRIQTQRAVGRP